jgi:glycosyltransferase involved in cell wall biosynthesis
MVKMEKNFNFDKIACLVPSYKPSKEFLTFIEKLVCFGYQQVIVIDDGGGEKYKSIFEKAAKLGCVVLTQDKNRGKGRALKTGIKYYLDNYPDGIGIVTADADGQHSLFDIKRVAKALDQNRHHLIMGCRMFGKEVPFKSKAGNLITRLIYRLASGIKLSDTQTGLRGLPIGSLEKLLMVKGERYEFEMSMLMELKSLKLDIVEVPIKTIYIDGNSASHFNAFRDSILVYGMIFSYIAASIFSFLVDYGLFTLLLFILPKVMADPAAMVGKFSLVVILSNIGARIVSTVVNFTLNKKILTPATSEKSRVRDLLLKYYALAVFALMMDTLIVAGLSIVIGSYIAKIISAIVIYVFNFVIQKRYIFV